MGDTAHPAVRHASRDHLAKKEVEMALSEEMSKLAARAKEAETRVTAARDKARAKLEREVSSAAWPPTDCRSSRA
jgi:hypothetical protein